MKGTLPLLLGLLAACGGGTLTHEPATQTSTGSERPAPPPVPLDPLALVPAEPAELVVIDLEAWRASPHFPTLRAWAGRFGCIPLGPELAVLSRTTRVVLAMFPRASAQGGMDVLVIGQGRYEPGDAPDVLGEIAEVVGPGPEPIGIDARGRFTVLADGARLASVLAPHLIVVGDAAVIERVLAMADRQGEPGVRDGATFRVLGVAQWLPERDLAIVSAGAEHGGSNLGGRIRGLDRSLARAVDRRPRAVSVSLGDGVALSWIASVGDEAGAQTQVADVQRALVSADLVLRLAGLPSLATRLSATVDGGLARFELQLGDREVASLVSALERIFATLAPPSCSAPAGAGM